MAATGDAPRELRRRRWWRATPATRSRRARRSRRITIDAGNFYFKPDAIDAVAGINTIKLVGDGGLHTLVFDDGKVPGFQLEVVGDGDTSAKKVDLKPGKYVFYCDIPNHRQQGMEGTITVK